MGVRDGKAARVMTSSSRSARGRIAPAMLAALSLAAMVGGCGGNAGGVRSGGAAAQTGTPSRIPPTRPAGRRRPPPAQTLALPGLEGVIGASAGDLARQFGPARLEVWEGDARKLQFSGSACVLDIYLYPPAAGGEPKATYMDARRSSDGKDVDRANCIAALRRR